MHRKQLIFSGMIFTTKIREYPRQATPHKKKLLLAKKIYGAAIASLIFWRTRIPAREIHRQDAYATDLELRRSISHAIQMQLSYSRHIGSAMAMSVRISGVGVMIVARTKISTTA